MVLFGFAILAVQLYKSELIRDIRARFLRRKLVPKVRAVLPLLLQQAAQPATAETIDYEVRALRADLESLFGHAKPLFNQERDNLAKFLVGLSYLSAQQGRDQLTPADAQDVVLLGQRVVQELTEIGL